MLSQLPLPGYGFNGLNVYCSLRTNSISVASICSRAYFTLKPQDIKPSLYVHAVTELTSVAECQIVVECKTVAAFQPVAKNFIQLLQHLILRTGDSKLRNQNLRVPSGGIGSLFQVLPSLQLPRDSQITNYEEHLYRLPI